MSEGGRSVLLASSVFERRNLFDKYVLGEPEPIRSSFNANDFETWILRLLTQIEEIPRDQVARLLASTYGGYLGGLRDPGWHDKVEDRLEALLLKMEELNLVEEEDGRIRLSLLTAMLSMLGLAAAVEAVGAEPVASVGFVVAYALMRLLLAGLFLRAGRHVPANLKAFVTIYAAGNLAGAAVWLSSLLVPEPARYGVWALGLFVELLAPILAVNTMSNPRVSFHPNHIPERYGLFTIIVLGESVLAVAVGTTDTSWAPAALLTAALGFVVAACIWWLYFDHVGSSGIELGPRPAFLWGYGHFAVYAGIAAFGVGVELAVEAAAATGTNAGAEVATLATGVALFLVAIAFVDRINDGRANDPVMLARLGVAALLLVLSVVGFFLPPLAFTALVTASLLALTAFETIRAGSRNVPEGFEERELSN